MRTFASLILLKDIKFLSNPEYVAHLEGFYSSHLVVSVEIFLVRQFGFWVVPQEHITSTMSLILAKAFSMWCHMIGFSWVDKINILIQLCIGRGQVHITSLIRDFLSLSRLLLVGSITHIHFLSLTFIFIMPRFTTFWASSHRLNQGFWYTLRLDLYTGKYSFVSFYQSTSHY